MQEDATQLTELLDAAKAFAREAGQLALSRFGDERELTQKGFRDFVTDADYAAQALIVERVRAQFPEHGFWAEEEDATLDANAEYVWIIDPIDGTTNYSHRIPIFSVSVGITYRGESLVGVIYDPARDELFWAAKDSGAFLNGSPITVSKIDDMADAIVAHDWSRSPAMRDLIVEKIALLAHQVRSLRVVGSAAIALCWVACGRFDAYFNPKLSAWDIAAGQLILAEAGGAMTGWNNEPFAIDDFSSWALALNERLQANHFSAAD